MFGVNMQRFISILIVFIAINSAYGQGKNFTLLNPQPDFELSTPKPPTPLAFLPAPADAISYALSDISTIPEVDRPFQRYVWIPDGDPLKQGQVSFGVNTAISQASVIIKPMIVAEGRMVRWDLRTLAPNEIQYARLHSLWEQLANEPYFHVTKTTDVALPIEAKELPRQVGDPVGSARFIIDGQTWFRSETNLWFILQENNWITAKPHFLKSQSVSVYGAHVGLQQGVMLQGLTQSSAAVVRYDWFLFKILSTLDGGLYYDFVGVDKNPKGKTAQQAFFESIGVTEQQAEQLRSDQRTAIFRSNVTGRPRRIDVFQSPGVRPSSGSGLVTITHDIGEGETKAENDPIRNLLELKDKARELIAERPNGMHIFLLFDNQGNLQNSAPDDVVKDHTIPVPHPARVQSAIGCIRCHGPFDGWQPFGNDVQKMLKGMLNVYDDLNSKLTIPETLDRLAGLYTGDLSKPIRRARDDYSDAVYVATNGQTVSQVSGGVASTYSSYHYELVDAVKACKELGYQVPEDKAVYYLNLILPPLQRDSIGISPEDPIIGALKAGLSVNRFQWESVYADAAFRSMQSQMLRENIKSVK